MAHGIVVKPQTVTINQGNTILVTAVTGEIDPEGQEGFFHRDTRYISHYHFTLNRHQLKYLSSTNLNYFISLSHFTNPKITARDVTVPEGAVAVSLGRIAGRGLHEDYDIVNYSDQTLRLSLELDISSDFADIFEVRGLHLHEKGTIRTQWDEFRARLATHYSNNGFRRGLVIQSLNSTSPPVYANGQIVFKIVLEPRASWRTCINCVVIGADGNEISPTERCFAVPAPDSEMEQLRKRWHAVTTKVETSHPLFTDSVAQSLEDMAALRLFEHDYGEDVWIPAAGVPWFVTLFGRDSLITATQSMMISPQLAEGALRKLAEYQGSEDDAERDEQPGRILHELREGELAALNRIPFGRYYGSVDATPLYLIALSEAYRWTGDATILERYRPTAENCLRWIEEHGDLDGDGFIEYLSRSPEGLKNQGWKDSGDSMVDADGKPAVPPIALCEVQGYIYDAKLRMAEMYDVWDESGRARQLRSSADALKQRFNDSFWVEDLGAYALGLDRDNRPLASMTSNPGHCLWSGIVEEKLAGRLVARLMAQDMFSGWGIRTLSRDNPAYSPISYHRGSVWPHDNSLIAAGFRRYGFVEEANRLIGGLLEACQFFDQYRMPELFAGFPKEPHRPPVPYSDANVPQAWAAASLFLLLQTMLGLRPDAPRSRLWVNPALPDWLDEVTLSRLKVGNDELTLRFWRHGEATRWELLEQKGRLEVRHEEVQR